MGTGFLFGVTKMLWYRIVVKAANHGTGHFKIVHLMYVIISQNGKKANPNRKVTGACSKGCKD